MLSEVLSFAITAVWVTVATVVTERLGTRVGAVVTTLPSALVVALYFIAVEQGTDFTVQVAAVVPAEMGINAVFLGVFVATSRGGLPTALASALAVWAVLSAGLYLSGLQDLRASLIVFLLLVSATSLWLRSRRRFEQRPGQHISYTPGEIAFRGLFAGLMISLSVVGASLGGPVLGGILSVFPAIFTSTMVILYLRQGSEFSGATGTIMVLGSANVVVYSVVVSLAYPSLGIASGTLVALVVSYAWSFCLYLALKRWIS